MQGAQYAKSGGSQNDVITVHVHDLIWIMSQECDRVLLEMAN